MTDTAYRTIAQPDLKGLSISALYKMQAAGSEVLECHRVLQKGGLNVSGEVLKGQGQFIKLQHYPKGDVYDRDTHSQYYYPAHRGNEHGHFHTFLRAKGMPASVTEPSEASKRGWPSGDQALAHIVAISMDRKGFPIRLFTTNRWVTAECWYKARDVIEMIDRFTVDHAYPSWPTNRWITAMMRLFRPQIVALLEARDAVIGEWRQINPDGDVFEDRGLETLTELDIEVAAQIKAIETALDLASATPTDSAR